MILPIKDATISQAFGVNYEEYKCYGILGHNGIDLCSFWGDEIYAAEAGTVVQVRDDKYGLGTNIRIVGKYMTIYAHLSTANVDVGDEVSAGQAIGLEGNTGSVRSIWDGKPFDPDKPLYTGTHLHFAVYEIGEPTSNSYQLHYSEANKTVNILNYHNGYRGAIDPYPLLYETMLKIVGDKVTKKQYLVGKDGRGTWIYNLAILDWLDKKGIVDKNEVEWLDKVENIDENTIALIK